MLDSQILKNNIEEFNENLKKRDLDVDTNLLIELDENRRKAKFEAEQIRAEQNKLGKEIAKAENEEKENLLKKAADLSESFKNLSLAGFLETGLSGNTLMYTLPPLCKRRVIAILADSICLAVIQSAAIAFKATSPNSTELPAVGAPHLQPRKAFLNLVLLGCNIVALLGFYWVRSISIFL